MTNTPTTTSSMQTVVLKVGLHCEGCERRVKKAIWHIKGITSVDVDNNRERVTVTGFVDPARILKAVKKTGKPVELWKYQNGNKNLFGSQPIAATPAKVANVSKGSKQNSSNSAGNNNKKQADFQNNILLSEHDRLQHPLPDYNSELDSDLDSFSGMDFYVSDTYADFKPQKNNKKNNSNSNNFLNDFKPSNTQKAELYGEFKSPKNQQPDFYDEFKPQKNQKKSDMYSEFKSPKNQKSDFYSDFKPPKNQQQHHQQQQHQQHQQQHQQQKSNAKNRSEYSSNKTTELCSDDENDFSSYNTQKSGFTGEQKSKASPYTGYGSHKDSSQPEYEFKKSGSNFSEQGNLAQYVAPGFENDEKTYNQKKQKSQVAPKYVSFQDEYGSKYRPQSESNHRAEDRGYEQKFFTSQAQEQSHYYPSYSYTYHDSTRVPANGFTNIFSEENPNACSIM